MQHRATEKPITAGIAATHRQPGAVALMRNPSSGGSNQNHRPRKAAPTRSEKIVLSHAGRRGWGASAEAVVMGASFGRSMRGRWPDVKSRTTTVRGRVMNAVTKEPVARALVDVGGGRAPEAVLTDDRGQFELKILGGAIRGGPGPGSRDQSDFDGTFLLPDVVPGTYTLVAVEDVWGFEWMKPAVLEMYIKTGKGMVVEPGETGVVRVDAVEVVGR